MNDSALEKEVLSGKPVLSITHGNSMEPLLYDKDTTVVIVKADKPLKNGDLPLYKRPSGQFVMHRIIKADSEYYYTRGDNRTGLEKVPKSWVLGLVTEINRHGKHISVTDKSYRCYVRLWGLCYPFRWLGMKIRGRLKRL